MAVKYALQGFWWRHRQYQRLKSKQSYNLYNLMFADTEYENVHQDLSLVRFAGLLICLVSMFLLALLFMPPRDEMLQYTDESGLINVYLIVLSFLAAPASESDLLRY